MSGRVPQVAARSVWYATPGQSYLVAVWGPRGGVERAWARLPAYWINDEDSTRARSDWMALAAAGSAALVPPIALGLFASAAFTREGGIDATPPHVIAHGDLPRYDYSRVGDWACLMCATPSRGTDGERQLSIEKMAWDLNAQGATDIHFAVISADSPMGSPTDRTNESIAEGEHRRQTWEDTIDHLGTSAQEAIVNVGETAEGGTSLLKSLTNPWVLIPVGLLALAATALFVVVPAILQVRVNR